MPLPRVARPGKASSETPLRRDSWLAPYLAAWLPFAVVNFAIFRAAGTPPALALRGTFAGVIPFGLLGILALRVPRRLPLPDERRIGFFAVQAGLVLAYTAAGTAGWLGLLALDQLLTKGFVQTWPSPLVVSWQAVIGALFYLSIAGAAYTLQNAARVREEVARAARADAMRARAELAALRTQLNPHFLLNTLHALLGLVRREPALAERALERLGELLHYGLRLHRDDVDQVTLREEWQFVRGYLEIESLRMGDRLSLSLEGEDGVMDCLVPPFALQPLVENAVRHGISPRRAGGRVEVRAHQMGQRLHLEVQDDGPGPSGGNVPAGTGLGLQLLRDRLAMLYDGRAILRLEAAGEGGFRATVELPIERWRSAEAT